MKRLKELRIKANLTQNDIANVLNISRASYTNYEIGKREPDFETISKLADYYHVSVDYLLEKTDNPTPSAATETDDEPGITLDTIEYALYGEAKELDDEEKQQLLDLAKLMRKKRKEYFDKK